jgi:hypothetical protein
MGINSLPVEHSHTATPAQLAQLASLGVDPASLNKSPELSNMLKLRLFTPKDPPVKLQRKDNRTLLQFEDAVEPWQEIAEDKEGEDIVDLARIPTVEEPRQEE